MAKRELALDDDIYRDILEAETGVRSCKDLDQEGVERVLKRFKELGFKARTYPSKRDRKKRSRDPLPQNVIELMTYEQKLKLDHLRHDMHLTRAGYRNLCVRTIGKSRPATVQEAQKMIEAMKAMLRRKSS